jgi:hypothetical protein
MRKSSTVLAIAGIAMAGILWTGFLSSQAAVPAGASAYHVIKTVPVPGDDGWDYVAVDSAARRVYISHGTHVVVMNADTYAIEGDIPDTPGVHGIAIAPDLGRGFISSGRANTATIFDLKTLKTIGTAKTDANPDAIAYDSVSKRVFTFNGRGKNATVINATDGTVVGTIALGGKPEFAVADGKGKMFANNEDTSEVMEIDTQTLTVTHRWPLAPCKSTKYWRPSTPTPATSSPLLRSATASTPTLSIRPRITPSPPTAKEPSLSSTRTLPTNSP